MHPILHTSRIMWAAMNATPVVFTVVLMIARPRDLEPEVPLMPFMLGAVALAVFATSVVLPRHQLDLAIRKLSLEQRTEVLAQETLFRDAAPTRQVFVAPLSETFRKIAPAFQTGFILGMALSEAVILVGFVLVFMGFDPVTAVPFFAVGWTSMLLRFPRVAPVARRIERLHGAVFPPEPPGA